MKNLLVLTMFVVVCFPAYKALRHPGLIYGHDAESVLFRSIEFWNAIDEGHFPVRWSKRLDYGLGQPTFTFIYNFPYYISYILGRLGFTELGAYKFLLAVSFPVSGWFAYVWLKEFFKDKAAIMGGLFYTYVPYHFLNVYVRAAFGEVVAATMVPLVLWACTRFAKRQTVDNLIGFAVTLGILALSHNMYLIVFLPVLPVYFLAVAPRLTWRTGMWLGAAMGLGVGLASYYLVPAYILKNSTFLSELGKWFVDNNNFVTMTDLLVPRWGFGGLRGQHELGLMSVQIGWVHVLVVMLAGWLTISQKNSVSKKVLIFFWVLLVGALVMMHEISLPIWRLLPILQNLQFPWRLMIFVNLSVGFLTALVFSRFTSKWLAVGAMVVLIVANRGYWHVGRYTIWDDPTIKSGGFPGTLTMLLEDTPKWHNRFEEQNPYQLTRTARGEAKLIAGSWTTNYQTMQIDCTTPECVISFKTHAWPGWQVKVDGQAVSLLDPYDDASRGLITFKVPTGQHLAEARLTETPLHLMANLMSLLAVCLLGTVKLFGRRIGLPAYQPLVTKG